MTPGAGRSATCRTASGAVLAAVVVAGLACGACSGGAGDPAVPAGPTPTTVRDGHLLLTPLDFACGITAVAGTHSEGPPEGSFCRATLRVRNPDPEFHTYVADRQRLTGVAAPRDRPASFPMAVRRQQPAVEIGGHDLIEVEVWWDVPVGSRVTGLLLAGDRDPVGFGDSTIVDHAPGGVPVPLRPTPGEPGTTPTAPG